MTWRTILSLKRRFRQINKDLQNHCNKHYCTRIITILGQENLKTTAFTGISKRELQFRLDITPGGRTYAQLSQCFKNLEHLNLIKIDKTRREHLIYLTTLGLNFFKWINKNYNQQQLFYPSFFVFKTHILDIKVFFPILIGVSLLNDMLWWYLKQPLEIILKWSLFNIFIIFSTYLILRILFIAELNYLYQTEFFSLLSKEQPNFPYHYVLPLLFGFLATFIGWILRMIINYHGYDPYLYRHGSYIFFLQPIYLIWICIGLSFYTFMYGSIVSALLVIIHSLTLLNKKTLTEIRNFPREQNKKSRKTQISASSFKENIVQFNKLFTRNLLLLFSFWFVLIGVLTTYLILFALSKNDFVFYYAEAYIVILPPVTEMFCTLKKWDSVHQQLKQVTVITPEWELNQRYYPFIIWSIIFLIMLIFFPITVFLLAYLF